MFRSRTVLHILITVSVLIALLFASYYVYDAVRVRKVIIASNEEGSSSHDFAVALAEAVQNADSRFKVRVVPTAGSAEIMDKLRQREADFGIAQLDAVTTRQALTVALLYPQVYHLVVKNDSDIKSFPDLKGKVVVTSSASGGGYSSFMALLDYFGMTDEVTVVPVDDGEERDAMYARGDADAMFRANTLGSDSLRELITQTDSRLIVFDQYEAMKLEIPTLFQYEIPKGTYRSADPAVPDRDVKTVGVPTVLFANSGVDVAVVKLFTRVLFENQNDLVHKESTAVFIESPVNEDYLLPAIHPGALAYYEREKPTLLEQYYDEISLLFTVGPIIASILFGLRSRFLARQKSKASEYNLELANMLADLMASDGTTAPITERKLLDSLNRAVQDMNDGDISQSDLQTFTLVWEKAMEAVRFRETTPTVQKKK